MTPPRHARRIADLAAEEGLRLLGWRDVPVMSEGLGAAARQAMPRSHRYSWPQRPGSSRPPLDIGRSPQ